MTGIVVYTTPACLSCRAARALLSTVGQTSREIDLGSGDTAAEALAVRTGSRTFPQVVIDGRRIGGYPELQELAAAGRLQARRPPAGLDRLHERLRQPAARIDATCARQS